MPYIHPLDSAEFSTVQVHRFITEECHFPVTLTKVELAAAAGELRSVRVTRKNKYSRRMALEWLASLGVQVDWDLAAAEAQRDVAAKVAL
ncbi:hypothetical protein A5791_10465 [Mycobacterium sp. 852002-51163_SCH5372311]|uniref:hypothetical protein n=1 Tax=Mycobacterium sp. 852002-51163_SCH5372311 TaxID=1834097 RepID=UPI000801F43C|nr:hypothetical protein [Mycobacterium sp. 852002-51163_SCH5372311]OBF79760.1 hypothetical protein A5791_10465 [Mycobacterium sp. 852002-51163_SCH5372311]